MRMSTFFFSLLTNNKDSAALGYFAFAFVLRLPPNFPPLKIQQIPYILPFQLKKGIEVVLRLKGGNVENAYKEFLKGAPRKAAPISSQPAVAVRTFQDDLRDIQLRDVDLRGPKPTLPESDDKRFGVEQLRDATLRELKTLPVVQESEQPAPVFPSEKHLHVAFLSPRQQAAGAELTSDHSTAASSTSPRNEAMLPSLVEPVVLQSPRERDEVDEPRIATVDTSVEVAPEVAVVAVEVPPTSPRPEVVDETSVVVEEPSVVDVAVAPKPKTQQQIFDENAAVLKERFPSFSNRDLAYAQLLRRFGGSMEQAIAELTARVTQDQEAEDE